MKKRAIYIFAACVALVLSACSKDDAALDYAAGEGGIVMRLAETRAVDISGLTLDDCTVFIYQNGMAVDPSQPEAEHEETATLIRKYTPGKCPETIRLLAGAYTVKVQWGEQPEAAAFEKCFYEGIADFEIKSGITETVTVLCKPQSVIVEVAFDSSIAATLADYSAVFELADSDAADKSLTFKSSDSGYFTVPDAGGRIVWAFRAQHAEKGEILKKGEIAAEVGKRYGLTFRYSPDLPGYISVDIEVDETTDDNNDVFIFSQDPEVNGEIFTAPQDFTAESVPEEMIVMLKAVGDAVVQSAVIYLSENGAAAESSVGTRAAAENETVVWRWPEDMADTSKVQWELSDDEKELKVSLSSKAILPSDAEGGVDAGRTDLRFELVDSYNAKADKTATIRIEGLSPVGVDDYDLWTNDLTLRAVSAKGAPIFRMRADGGEWYTLNAAMTATNEYMAILTDDDKWTASENAVAGTIVYRPKQGLYANHHYEFEVEIAGRKYSRTLDTSCDQSIPYGDMADASLSCFTTDNANAPYWGSGNNSFAKELCTYATKSELPCAHLKSTMAGMLGITMLAAGNLFTGTFVRPSTTGTVSFGLDYDWKARPTAMHVKYHAKIGTVNQQKHKKNGSHPANIGDQDKAIVYVAIVDWSNRHGVSSGTGAPSGVWSPDEAASQAEGPIIGYGIFRIDTSTEGDDLVDFDIPIYYYDKTAKPSKQYKLVISSATNIYGDYMCGCDSNELYLTDFRWVY